MTQYLVTDCRTNETTWVTAPSKREACILHENDHRARNVSGRNGRQLPINSKASHDSGRVSVGDSAVIGLDVWVKRAQS